MSNINTGNLESRKDFKDTKQGQYQFWSEEITASEKARRNWHKQGDKIVKRYLDARKDTMENAQHISTVPFRLNLFYSNVTSLTSMLYGNLPKVDVSRRYDDSLDDVGRVAAEIMERLLNMDIAENGEEYNTVLRSTLQDRLLPGLGCARLRYEVETETTQAEVTRVDEETGETTIEMIDEERVVSESAPIDYFHWRDVLWGWGRAWTDLPWIAYRSFLNKDEVEERFDKDAADNLQFKRQLITNAEDRTEDPDTSSPWMKAEIWEIWDKEKRQIIFWSKGYDKILDTKEDSLKLTGFYPSPPFFMANKTTSIYEPTPDFHLAQDLYTEIDKLQTRIAVITEACKVVGVYDETSKGIQRMFKEGIDNTLIPVENWAMFGEKGGLQGQIDWLPLQDIVGALDKLRELRDDTIQLLYQVTGMNETMRGGSQGQYEGVGQAQLQAKFGSVRVQALQDEFAAFASDIMQLKAEIIARHFEPATIAKQSNIDKTFDAEVAQPAIALIKNVKEARLKVEIRPESVAMVDYAQLKAERTDYITALATFLQSAGPMMEKEPKTTPFLLQLLGWGLAGFKGAQEIEGVLDKAIEVASQAQEEPKEDPAKKQMEMQQQLEQAKIQGQMQIIEAKSQAEAQKREQDMQADIQTAQAESQAKLAEIQADLESELTQLKARMRMEIETERATSAINAQQAREQAGADAQKSMIEQELDIEKEIVKAELKIDEMKSKPTGGDSDAT